MRRTQLTFCLLLAAGCASTAPRSSATAGPQGDPARVVFRDLRQGQTFALVNEAHSDPLELYSKTRSAAEASTKVIENEVMDALLDYLEGEGDFFDHARPGPAPATGFEKVGQVETDRGTFHMAVSQSSPEEEQQDFLRCYMNFVALWSNVQQFQAVENPGGSTGVFQKPEHTRRPYELKD